MSKLKIHPQADEGRIVHVTPESAGWTYVGFDLWKLKPGQKAQGGEAGREVCLVFISGKGHVTAGKQDFGVIGLDLHSPAATIASSSRRCLVDLAATQSGNSASPGVLIRWQFLTSSQQRSPVPFSSRKSTRLASPYFTSRRWTS